MSNTYTHLLFHVIFSTKNRKPFISSELQPKLYSYIFGILRQEKCHLLNIGGTADHVHLLVKMPSDRALADIMRVVKSNSSKWVNEECEGNFTFAWQAGYGAFSVSQSQTEMIAHYIDNQATHHHKASFREELIKFLDKHGVNYNPEYI